MTANVKMFIFITIFLSVLNLALSLNHNHPFCRIRCRFNNNDMENSVCVRYPCQLDYSYCGPDAEVYPLQTYEKFKLQDFLNKFRSKFAEGKILPNIKVSDMRIISYSSELEFAAQCWANSCILVKAGCNKTPTFQSVIGQIFRVSKVELSVYKMGQYIMNITKDFGHFADKIFDQYRVNPNERINDLIQILWAATNHFGCGRIINRGQTYLLCYFAPGAENNLPPFSKGAPCSKCPVNELCVNKIFPGLCGIYSTHHFNVSSYFGNTGVSHRICDIMAFIIFIMILCNE